MFSKGLEPVWVHFGMLKGITWLMGPTCQPQKEKRKRKRKCAGPQKWCFIIPDRWDPLLANMAHEEQVYTRDVNWFKISAETLHWSLHLTCTRCTWTSIQSPIQLTYTRLIRTSNENLNPIGQYLCRWQWVPYIRIVFYLRVALRREKKTRASETHPYGTGSFCQSIK